MKFKILSIIFLFNNISLAQINLENLTQTILTKDSIFWHGYNTCQFDLMETYLDKNVEFYHDKGGLMRSAEKVLEATRNNICGLPNIKILRVALSESIKVYPLENNNQIYGAVLVGDHFFIKTAKRPERLNLLILG